MKKLESLLKQLKRSSKPGDDFKVALWSDLEVEFVKTYPTSVGMWHRIFVVPMAVLIIFSATGTGVYAYSSPSVTANHGLYPIKSGIESVESSFPRSPEKGAQFHSRMMDRRLAEGEFLYAHKQLHSEVMEEIASEFQLTIEELMQSQDNPEIREAILNQASKKIERYDSLVSGFVQESKESLEYHHELMRNKHGMMRVYISESGLTDSEKSAFLERLQFNQEELIFQD